MKTFRCEFLGCKVNQYDAERARRFLLRHGYRETEQRPSVLLLASCTVTANAARRGRQAARSILRRNPGARILVLGCMTEEDRRFYESLCEPVTLLPSARDDGFLATLLPLIGGELRPARSVPAQRVAPRRTRAYLKVEDGCDLHCTFCVIPSVRGRARSRPIEQVESELAEIVAAGTREIVLTGVHLGHYGRRARGSLAELLRRLDRMPGSFRLRLSSLEASELSGELLDVLGESSRLVPHLHLPLQSGSPRVLRAMRRPYTADRFRRAVDAVRARLEEPSLTTDVLVGFPGETERDFELTLDLCRLAGFSKIHTFPFSARRGTVAAELGERVPGDVVRARKARLAALEAELRRDSLGARRGKIVEVVVEKVHPDGVREGYDERYHRTRLLDCDSPAGAWLPALVESHDADHLHARPLASAAPPA